MKVAFLNASISRMAGGVFEVQRRLAQNLNQIKNVSIEVFGIEDRYTQSDIELWLPFKPVIHQPMGPAAFAYSPQLLDSLRSSNADVIHLHVLWLYPSIAILKSNKPYITTIHGMLDKWAVENSRFKKKIVGTLYEKKALKKASCLQAITGQEYQDIRNFGLKNPVCMIPNGVDIPLDIEKLKNLPPVWENRIENGKKVLLYLGRIHPKKGLTNLIKAWKLAQSKLKDGKDWALAIVGWEQGGYEGELKRMVSENELESSVFFLGPQFQQNKDLCFAHASAFILPSFSEGLPMAVLEAWAYELPVLMTPECNLPEGFEVGAAFHIETSVESIYYGLSKLFSCNHNQLSGIGWAGKILVVNKFDWKNVANEMHKVYNWIIDKGPLPENIILR